ncbi:MAG: hypothetical protein ACUVRV_09460 [Cyanobacteriota bacterium]
MSLLVQQLARLRQVARNLSSSAVSYLTSTFAILQVSFSKKVSPKKLQYRVPMLLPPDAGAWWWVLLASLGSCIPLSLSGLGFWLTNLYSSLFKDWFGHYFAERLELGGLFLAILLNILYRLGFLGAT